MKQRPMIIPILCALNLFAGLSFAYLLFWVTLLGAALGGMDLVRVLGVAWLYLLCGLVTLVGLFNMKRWSVGVYTLNFLIFFAYYLFVDHHLPPLTWWLLPVATIVAGLSHLDKMD